MLFDAAAAAACSLREKNGWLEGPEGKRRVLNYVFRARAHAER